ncbi:MAG: hypothetical protein ACRDE2_06135 [Chitinophagaceae bacterium]
MKKRIIILLSGIFLVVSAKGQITKGTWMTGGNAGIVINNAYYPMATTNLTTVSIAPDIGYFVIEKLTLGINASYELITGKNNNVSQTTQHSYTFGPFARYYFLPVDHIVNLFAGGYYKHYILEPGNSITNTYSFFAGPTAFFNSSVAIEMTAGFSSLITKNSITNSFVINAGFQIYLIKQ